MLAVLAFTGFWGGVALSGEINGSVSRDRTVYKYDAPGRYNYDKQRTLPPDPVQALVESDLDLIKEGMTADKVKKLLDSYVTRMLDCYKTKYKLPQTLCDFLDKDKNAKEIFITALDPRYDDVTAAASIFEALRVRDEKLLSKYAHLATAIAVVYDQPDSLSSSRYNCLWGLTAEQFQKPPDYMEIYGYYTDPGMKARLAFQLEQIPWPMLVHLVDNDITPNDRLWALSRYNAKVSVETLYPSVPYDYDKYGSKDSHLGNKPYSLPNILQFGGVCGDQAYFTSRVAKCLGVPSMKVDGEGRYGGSGHCWAGYLVVNKGRPVLEFTGRYFYDYYYTGNIFDPQTRTDTLDRYVAMMYDGVSLSYPKYNQSMLFIRMAEAIKVQHPKESLILTTEGLKLNYFNMWGWPLLMQHIHDGTLAKKDGLKWFNEMLRVLKDHPDMTFECLNTFKECMPKEDVKGRQSLYNQVFTLYKTRPDLQLKLRVSQAEELVAANMKLDAMNALIPTVVDNAKEGTLALPAARMAVRLAKELGVKKQASPLLEKADGSFPKDRSGRPSEAYAEFRGLLDELKR
jgi:hypothetical protein